MNTVEVSSDEQNAMIVWAQSCLAWVEHVVGWVKHAGLTKPSIPFYYRDEPRDNARAVDPRWTSGWPAHPTCCRNVQ